MFLEIPLVMKEEHAELHRRLEESGALAGETGRLARSVTRLLDLHFRKEEECVLPPLGLLPELARDRPVPFMEQAIPLADALRKLLPRLMEEHRAIAAELARLSAAARAEDREGARRLAEDLSRHVRFEEDILYPAALLIGSYVKEKLYEAMS